MVFSAAAKRPDYLFDFLLLFISTLARINPCSSTKASFGLPTNHTQGRASRHFKLQTEKRPKGERPEPFGRPDLFGKRVYPVRAILAVDVNGCSSRLLWDLSDDTNNRARRTLRGEHHDTSNSKLKKGRRGSAQSYSDAHPSGNSRKSPGLPILSTPK